MIKTTIDTWTAADHYSTEFGIKMGGTYASDSISFQGQRFTKGEAIVIMSQAEYDKTVAVPVDVACDIVLMTVGVNEPDMLNWFVGARDKMLRIMQESPEIVAALTARMEVRSRSHWRFPDDL